MAYGLLCSNCGRQETDHKIDREYLENTGVLINSHQYTLDTCPGFQYAESDYEIAIQEFIDDPVEIFPQELREMAEERKDAEFTPIKHSVWAILSNGKVVDIGG